VTRYFKIALGILAAIGGFVDIGDLVFTTQAGAAFGYEALWAVPVGVLGIVTYAEMCGRVAAVTKRPVLDVVRQRLGFGVGLATLIAGFVLSLLTLTAELGGLALALRLFFDLPFHALLPLGALVLIVVVWITPFEWIERIFGYLGLALLVYVAAAIDLSPDWSGVGQGFVPQVNGNSTALYLYFIVGLIAAALMPYEVYFYSSGALEERWKPKDLGLNRANAVLGFGLGGIMSVALVITAAEVFHPAGVQPDLLGTTVLGADVAFGEIGIVLALIGILFAVSGAAIDTALAGAYNLSQFFGWEWGRYRGNREAPRFALAWVAMFVFAYLIASTGVDPLLVTEYSVVLSVVALPFTYLPVLLIARDSSFMGSHANGRLSSAVGWLYMAVIAVVSVIAIPLLLITNAGSPS
jgi:Mn2+/Fe2+ NRAMP family transporter